MKRLNQLSTLFNIHPGEERLFLLLFLQFFLLGVSFNFLETTAFPLFLTEFTPQTLPYIYIANAVVVPLIIALYLRLSKYVSFGKLLVLNLSFLLLVILIFRLSLALTEAGWLVFSLPILFQMVVSLGFIAFWTLAGRLFNVRQAKRLFGLLGSGFWIAIVVTGFFIPPLVGLMGTANLLLLSAGGMVSALVVLLYITRTYAGSLTTPETSEPSPKNKAARPADNLFRNRYVVLMFSLSVVAWISFFFVDNIFYNRVAAQFPDHDQVASFLGLYLAGLGILTLLINTFLTGPVLNRYGLRFSLLLLPLALLTVTLLFIVSNTLFGLVAILFWLATLNRLFDLALTFSIDQSAQTILYQPLPADQRSRVQTIDEGIVRMVGIGTAGVLLLLLNVVLEADVILLAYVLLFIVIGWIGVVFLTGREYPLALMKALTKRKLDDTTLLTADRLSLTILQQNLESPHVGVVLYALDRLEELAPDAYPTILQNLLGHPEREVRLEVLRRIERLELTATLPTLREKLRYEASRPVRGALLRTLAALGEPEAFDLIYPYLDDPDPQFRQGALIGLLRSGELEGTLAAGEKLQAGIHAADPNERVFAAQVLGEAGLSGLYRPLLKLIHDDQPLVVRAALEAAGKVRHPKLWPAVVEALSQPQVRAAAAAALISGGRDVLPVLETVLSHKDRPVEVLNQMARICGRLGGEKAIDLLRRQLTYPDERVRTQVLLALGRCNYHASDDQARAFIQEQIKAEVFQAAWLLGAQVRLKEGEQTDPLVRLNSALENSLLRHRLRLLIWLFFLYDPASMLRVRDILSPAGPAFGQQISSQQRAYALELLDVMLPAEQKSLILPLLDDLAPAQRLQRLPAPVSPPPLTRNEILQAVIGGSPCWFNPWSKICALAVVDHLKLSELSPAVAAVLSAPDAPVRETAVWTLARLDRVLYRQYAEALANDASPVVTRVVTYLETLTGDVNGPSPAQQGEANMLSTVEKVIVLKSLDFFAETSEETLVEITTILEDIDVAAGETFLQKDELDSSLYLLIEGQVRVHDGNKTIAELGEGDVIGELSLLDPAPRSASVTAVGEARLFRLDQAPFYELLADRTEMAFKMLQVLARRLRRSSGQNKAERARDDLLGGLKEKLSRAS